jgi:pilus assembly protein CpaC
MKKTQIKGYGWGLWGITVVLSMVILTSRPLLGQSTSSIQVSVGTATVLPVENVAKLAVADPSIADVVALSDKEISVIGKKVGATTLTVVHTEDHPTVVYTIEVGNEAAAVMIRKMINSKDITVRSIGDALVLDGKVTDEIEAQRAVQVAGAYKGQVINLLEITNPRQIKIRTRIAEVSTDAIKNLGIQYFGPNGQVAYGFGRLSITEPSGGQNDFSGHMFLNPSQAGNQTISAGSIPVGVEAVLDLLIQKNTARLLSEPTLVTYSGKEASFLVGEEVPIVEQLPQSFTVEFKEVGVRMKIKPTADSENRINTTIHAEVSQVIGTGASGLPIIGAKTADAILQVKDGQTIVIAGLLENNIDQDLLRKLPWLGDIPVLGALFRDKQFHQAKREVLFLMTPEVIKDIDADTAAGAKTPVMQQWINRSDKGLLKSLNKKDDWGVHSGGYSQDAEVAEPKKAGKPAAPATSGGAPATNYQPAHPTGN